MEKIWGYVVGATIFGSVTGFIVLIIKNLLKNKINKRYAYLFWMILVIKLIIPFGPESNISLFNKIPINYNNQKILSRNTTKLDNIDSNDMSTEDTKDEVNATTSTYQDNNSVNENITRESQVVNNKPTISTMSVKSDKFSKILFFVWLSGFVFSAVTYMIIYMSFIKDLKKCSKLKYEILENILRNCKNQLNINKRIQIVVYDKISSPSLVGMMNLKIVLPRNLINLSEEELRHIFLHELCHYKNKDNYMDNLIGLLQCIHWFNPLIHYYFKKMRNDMEICCDERVLNLLNEDEHNKYGITILNVLEKINFNHKMRVGLNMANDKKTIKKRINLIKNNKNFSKNRKLFMMTGIICLLVMGGALLTNGKSVNADEDLDKAISSVILGEYRPAHKKEYPAIYLGEGELPVEAHEILGKSIKNDKIEVYLMATYGSYEFQNDVFNMVNSSSQIPLQITLTTDEKQGHKLKDNNKYYLVDIKIAEDGSKFVKSIKDMFPMKEAIKALAIIDDTKKSEKLFEEINQDATKYVESLGRKSKVTYNYVEKENIDESVLENIWKLEQVDKYPDYIGTREVIENKKRYIYETDYSKTTKVLCFAKTDENNEIVEETCYEIDNNKIKKLDSDKYVSYKKYSGKDFLYIQEYDVTFTINEIKIVNNEAKLYVTVKNESDKDLHISMDNLTIGENKKSMDMEVTIGKGESVDNILTIKSISKISDLNDKHTGTILIRDMNNADDVQKIDFINKF